MFLTCRKRYERDHRRMHVRRDLRSRRIQALAFVAHLSNGSIDFVGGAALRVWRVARRAFWRAWRSGASKLRRISHAHIFVGDSGRVDTATTIALAALALITMLGLAFSVGRAVGHRAGADYCRERVNLVERALDALREADVSLLACEGFLAPLRPDKWKTKTIQQRIAAPQTTPPCKNCGGGP